jgi:gluconate 2-dehydrogenase alpha chain
VVGRNYSYQIGSKVTLFFDDREFNPFIGADTVGTAIDDFNGDNFNHQGLGFMGGAYVATQTAAATPIRSKPVPAGTPRWGADWKKNAARYYRRSFAITLHGTCQSYRTRYLDLDPTYRDANGLPLLRMTFDWHENERKMSAWITSRMAEIAKAIGPSKMSIAEPTAARYSIVPYQSTHNVGGAVMGADPATSAVNKYLQTWDVPNLFVIGGSAFPQNSASGPTATIGALACWAADSIKDRYLKRPGALV